MAAGPSRPSFRPRPIDLTKPLPIIKSSKDLRHEDDVVVNRALPTIATGVDPSEEEERHLQQALLASVFGNSDKPPDIPVPVVSVVEPPFYESNFELPERYIIFDRTDAELVQDGVEYDADYIDEEFARDSGIPIEFAEIGVDCLEKTQGTAEVLISYTNAKPRLVSRLPNLTATQRDKLYSHWHCRRQKHKRPFLRCYQSPPDPNDSDPAVAFRPRDREAGAKIAHRLNTYDNYRRVTILRDELVRLRRLLADIVEREQKKAQIVSIRLLQQRTKITSAAITQTDNIVRHIFTAESEPILLLPSNKSSASSAPPTAIVPCKWINIPDDISTENRRLVIEKTSKKSRRKSKPADKRNAKDFNSLEIHDRSISSLVPQISFDTFGFDEHGNRFLKLMRCFSGGFNNYGVSPYDHRVFAAASERNTVRAQPREPKAVTFPGPEVKFGRSIRRVCTGGKVGPRVVDPREIEQDILSGRETSDTEIAETRPSKARRVIRVRGRVGRGGRIFLDRVTFERERGVKAASYPASVGMGGVYTGGIPLDAAKRVSQEVSFGAMGEIARLSPTSVIGDDKKSFVNVDDNARLLVPPLKPIMEAADGIGIQPNVLNYWPRQRKGLHTQPRRNRGPPNFKIKTECCNTNTAHLQNNDGAGKQQAENLRRLPAYYPRNSYFVNDVSQV